jgi:hypothetical protein
VTFEYKDDEIVVLKCKRNIINNTTCSFSGFKNEKKKVKTNICSNMYSHHYFTDSKVPVAFLLDSK